jgi:glycosyltransferase involved in cell wall biosynthesis
MHLIPYTGRDQGGPVINLAACAAAQVAAGCRVSIFSVVRPSDGRQMEFDPQIYVTTVGGSRWGAFRRCPELWRRASAEECDLIHSHGLWTDVNRLAMALARRRHLPHLVTPCGTLAPGALRHRWWKKTPVKAWFQVRALRQTNCLQAQSESEYNDIRRFGLRNPVAMIPAAVAGPPRTALQPNTVSPLDRNIVAGRKIVLFLGRLHRVKGLARLIAAWSSLRAFHRDWLLVLAGPDEGGYQAELEAQIEQVGCNSSVILSGPLDDAEKWAALAQASLFVMPSDFENFGLAIVEAMLSALPVITTTGTPWKELSTAHAGWWVPAAPTDVGKALAEGMGLAGDERRAMGKRAAALAAQFRPEQAAADLIRVYRWMLNEIPRPACVRLD